MAVDVQEFGNTAAKLYDLWPPLFNWLGGIVSGTLVFIVTATWWARAYKADRDIAILKNEKTTIERDRDTLRNNFEIEKRSLQVQFDSDVKVLTAQALAEKTGAEAEKRVLEQRLQLAAQQNAAAKEEAERIKTQISELKEKTRSKVYFENFGKRHLKTFQTSDYEEFLKEIEKADYPKDLEIAIADLDTSFDHLLKANTNVSKTLKNPIFTEENWAAGGPGRDKGATGLPPIKLSPD
jgi:hypothetical protein